MVNLTSLESWHAWDSFSAFFENEQAKIKDALVFKLTNNGVTPETIAWLEPKIKMFVESACTLSAIRFLKEIEMKRVELENTILAGLPVLKHL